MRDTIAIAAQCYHALPLWRANVKLCKEHQAQDFQVGQVFEIGDRGFIVPPLTFAGFLGYEVEWYYYKKRNSMQLDTQTKFNLIMMALIVGATAFGLRMLGVWFCTENHVHEPLDEKLVWCILFSGLFWLGVKMSAHDD